MRFHGSTLLLLLIAATAVPAANRRATVAPEDSLAIVAPSHDGSVQTVDTVVIETKLAGYPVVVVRADERNALWWAQPDLKLAGKGRYAAACHFGNAKTPLGRPFHVTVALVRTPQDVARFHQQATFRSLPTELSWAKPLRVVRGAPVAPKEDVPALQISAAQKGQIVTPASGAQVTRMAKVNGKIGGELDPVVLVRSAEPNSPWWVQSIAARDKEGRFAALARFGNDKTAPGSRFHLIAVAPRSPAEAQQYQVGRTLKSLPEELPRTNEVVVITANPNKSAP